MDTTNNHNNPLRIIVLANQPRMLREMLHRALDKTPNVRLVLETDTPNQIPNLLNRVQADWLIASLDNEEELPPAVEEALEENPSLSVLGLSADGSHVEVQHAEDDGSHEQKRFSLANITLSDLMDILSDGQPNQA